jgi:hypothetical protein
MAATSIDPDQDLVKTLEHVRTPGSFTGYGILDPLDPQLYVPEIGIISIPLQNAQAKNLIRACHQAPFGKGSETVLDLSIRNTQELNADQFEIRNPAWQEYISRTTERAARDLGVCGQNVRADLYKLLLYGPGAHFHKHKEYIHAHLVDLHILTLRQHRKGSGHVCNPCHFFTISPCGRCSPTLGRP